MSLWRSTLRNFTAVHQCGVKSLQSFISATACLYEKRVSVRSLSLNHILVISAQGNNAKNTGASSSSPLPSSSLLGSCVSRPHIDWRPYTLTSCTNVHHATCIHTVQLLVVVSLHSSSSWTLCTSWWTFHGWLTTVKSLYHCSNITNQDKLCMYQYAHKWWNDKLADKTSS